MIRRHDLDWVRVCAFGLLVLYHVGMYYVSWDWHVKSPAASPALEPLMLLTSPWRLSLLFLVSGAATAFLLARGRRGFLRQRSLRLLLPLLFGMLVVVTPQAYYEVVEKLPGGYHEGYGAFWLRYLAGDGSFCREGDCLDLPTWNHLWFVAYLWVYTVLLAAGVWLLPERWRTAAGDFLARRLDGWGALLWPIALLAAVRIALVARFESTHGLFDDWYNHAQYLPLFLLGFACATRTAFWQTLERLRWPALTLATLGYLSVAWYFALAGYTEEAPPPDWLRIVMRTVWAIDQWASIAAIFGFAYRLRERDSATLRYLVPAVFPVYILHQSVTVALAHELKPLGLTPLLEGPLLVVATFALCFAGYEVIRRVTLLRPLFGLKWREQPRSPALPVDAAAAGAG